MEGFGLRYQLSSINAAIGLAQLPGFKTTEVKRQRLWRAYRTALHGAKGITLVDVDVDHTVPHLCVVRVADREVVFRRPPWPHVRFLTGPKEKHVRSPVPPTRAGPL
ncbi:DegT/DnrJ/EryC1/StrS family aminotransferase [Kitasatospora sp. NPDC059462]|uniref:DegT/DnrJ/EryC1/StrS family aminotransferase n=1 Tax=Kitasatospora sp. NPDC059462 TaxID=3346841 RepID=UPI0036A35A00